MKRILVIISILILLALIAATIYHHHEEKNEEENELLLYGNIDIRQVDLGFRVEGLVTKLYFEEGDYVPSGSLVAELDTQPYLDLVRQAKATLEVTKVNFANAEKLLKRRQELVADGSIAKEDLENAEATRDALFASVQENEAALAVSMTNLSFTKAYAPTEGIILTRIREPGTVVNASNPVFTLSIISPVWVRAYVPEPYLGVIKPGMVADVFTDTKNGKVYKGHVGFISPVAEFTPKTVETTELRTTLVYRLRIYADNPDQGLRQGMPVTVKFHLPKEKK